MSIRHAVLGINKEDPQAKAPGSTRLLPPGGSGLWEGTAHGRALRVVHTPRAGTSRRALAICRSWTYPEECGRRDFIGVVGKALHRMRRTRKSIEIVHIILTVRSIAVGSEK